ncbi:MAG TPA: cupredoxin domain-containing protein [Rubrobacteraceae bacterium]|nr:cupredoxin domain-containing protein [Rubrobacteraceae bacterium]
MHRTITLIYLSVCVSAVVFMTLVDAASAHENEGGDVVVHVTEAGFDPQSVEVGVGETVVFENLGQEAHWPASDDHPMHTVYPEFDPLGPVEPGTEWSFTFDKPGTWKYHDHQGPNLKGEVIVRQNGGFLASVQNFFLNAYRTTASILGSGEVEPAPGEEDGQLAEGRYEEVKGDYVALVRDEDPRAALSRMRGEIETDDALARSCHALVHDIGRESYRKYEDFGEAMKYQDEICNSGYLHGIIEARFSESEDVFADMETMCDEYPLRSTLSWQCYHGLGHGVMYYTANDLPRSLEMCDAFDSDFARSTCSNGLFMENFSADQKLHLSEYLKESDPLYPCAEQAERHKPNCYVYAPTYFLSLNQEDYAGALESCNGAEGRFQRTCAGGVGAQAMKENINDPKLVESACKDGSPQQVEPCVKGMMSLYINHHGSTGPARELCGRLEDSNQQACYGSIESHDRLFSGQSS